MNLGGIGSGLFDFATSAWSMNEEQKYNTAEAQTNRNFQERMADTAYQRAVKDLNAAGLSPMLAYSKGGAATPSGATAGGTQGAKSDISGAMERSAQSDLLKEQMEVAKSQKLLNESNALKAQTESYNIAAQTSQFYGKSSAEIKELEERAGQHGASALQLKALIDEIRQNIAIKKPTERFSTEEPEKAKWMNPLRDALQTIFSGVGTLGGLRGINRKTTTQGPKGTTVQTTKGNR